MNNLVEFMNMLRQSLIGTNTSIKSVYRNSERNIEVVLESIVDGQQVTRKLTVFLHDSL